MMYPLSTELCGGFRLKVNEHIEANISKYLREQFKEQKVSYKELAWLLNEQSGEKKGYTENGLRTSLSRGSLKAKDLILIMKVLNIHNIRLEVFC